MECGLLADRDHRPQPRPVAQPLQRAATGGVGGLPVGADRQAQPPVTVMSCAAMQTLSFLVAPSITTCLVQEGFSNHTAWLGLMATMSGLPSWLTVGGEDGVDHAEVALDFLRPERQGPGAAGASARIRRREDRRRTLSVGVGK